MNTKTGLAPALFLFEIGRRVGYIFRMSHSTKTKTMADYVELGSKLGLKFGDPKIPKNTRTKGNWKCLRCGYEFLQRSDVLQASKATGCKECSFRLYGESKRLGKEVYETLALAKRLKLVGRADVRSTQKTKWICMDCGKEYERSFESVSKLVDGCAPCAKLRKVAETLGKILAERGAHPKERLPKSTKDSVWWLCPNGHDFFTSTDNITQGRMCKTCGIEKRAAQQRLPGEAYETMGVARMYPFIGLVPNNVNTQTRWDCARHGSFRASYTEMKEKKNCPKCKARLSSERQRTSEDKYIALGKRLGCEYLGPLPHNQQQDTYWNCEYHGPFSASYRHFQYDRQCWDCGRASSADKQRATAQQYHRLAKQNGCDWIGKTLPKSAWVATEFRCWGKNKTGKKHVFRRTYGKLLTERVQNLQSKLSACQKCTSLRRESKPQEILFHRLTGFGRRFREYKERHWKIGAVDILLRISSLKIAIEYDGWHHHKNRLEKDRKKRQFLRSRGYAVLRVKANQSVPSIEQLEMAIDLLVSGRRQWTEITMPDWGV